MAGRSPSRLRRRWNQGVDARAQARELNRFILEKLERDQIGGDAREKFVESRFQARMSTHLSQAPLLAYAHTAIGVLGIAGGVGASSVAASDRPDATIVVVLGLVVAAATATNQIFKFGQRSSVRFRAGNDLRREAWDFILEEGPYAGLEPKKAFSRFYRQIWRIEAPVDTSVEIGGQDTA